MGLENAPAYLALQIFTSFGFRQEIEERYHHKMFVMTAFDNAAEAQGDIFRNPPRPYP